MLLVAWQAHTFISDTSHVFTSLEHYLPAVNGLLFNIPYLTLPYLSLVGHVGSRALALSQKQKKVPRPIVPRSEVLNPRTCSLTSRLPLSGVRDMLIGAIDNHDS